MQLLRAAVALAMIVAATGTRADEDSSSARKHYQRGMAHYNLGEYKPAIAEFQEAYRLHPDPAILFNLGHAYRLDHDPENAIKMYKSYLRASENPPNRAEVESRIAELEKLMPPPDASHPAVEKPAPADNSQATPPSIVATETKPAPPQHTPVYKKWWLWTVVGVVVAGGAVGLGVGLSQTANRTYPAVSF